LANPAGAGGALNDDGTDQIPAATTVTASDPSQTPQNLKPFRTLGERRRDERRAIERNPIEESTTHRINITREHATATAPNAR
jgi:hypothetical protein